jgi:hypothetical protein
LKERKEKHVRADEELHKDEAKPEKGRYINKYGFLHVDKNLAKHLGVEFGKDKADVPVTIEEIPGGFVVKILKS